MKVLVSGASGDIGKAIAELFLERGHEVVGLDIQPASISHPYYTHIRTDVREALPEVEGVEIVVVSHGIQLPDDETIDVNLKGAINVVEKYAFHPRIRSVVTIGSASGRNGSEFPCYAASKAGLITYTKNVALRLAKWGATANSVSPGGVVTGSNACIIDEPKLYQEAIDESLLDKWALPSEIAEWVYFVSVVNRSMTGEDVLIDNGEMLKSHFVWPAAKSGN
ncbi:MAG: SDR family oxidoreductase [Clostridia bacterium]|nr:SDR family oxidoreductase [Clostridia bacterium]